MLWLPRKHIGHKRPLECGELEESEEEEFDVEAEDAEEGTDRTEGEPGASSDNLMQIEEGKAMEKESLPQDQAMDAEDTEMHARD